MTILNYDPKLNENGAFKIDDPCVILGLLDGVQREGDQVALHYGKKMFALTSVINTDASGVWLEIPFVESDCSPLVEGDGVDFVSSHCQIKMHFHSPDIKVVEFGASRALFIPMPQYIFRIQRREFFRVKTDGSAKISIPGGANNIEVVDISESGVGLIGSRDVSIKPEHLKSCNLEISSIGIIAVSIEITNDAEKIPAIFAGWVAGLSI